MDQFIKGLDLSELFYKECVKPILEDEEIKSIKFAIGSVNQFIDSTDVLCNPQLCKKVKEVYQ